MVGFVIVSSLFAFVGAEFSNLLAARIQMAFTLGFHIILACLGVGLPVLILFAEWRFLRTKDKGWKTLARRWSKAFAVLFAVGAVSGTVLSFELGLLWPEFMGTFGSVFGMPFMLEGFAFFIEAIFLGIYLYTWDRLSPWAHWLSGIPVAISGLASAWFVVAANAWMNTPQGFRMEGGRVIEADPLHAIFNPSTGAQTLHMILAAYMVTGFLVASFYALEMLRGKKNLFQRRAMVLGLTLGTVLTPFQFLSGDWLAKTVAETQPIKFAAMEGQFKTEARAPLRIGGIPDERAGTTRFAVEIPGMLSWLAYGDADKEVKGYLDFPPEIRPPILIVHLAFQLMVAIGAFLIFLAVWSGWSVWKKKPVFHNRVFLWLLFFSGPLVVLALEAGWVVTEVGRQPWIVVGFMKTADAVTKAPGIIWSLTAVVGIYIILTLGTIFVLRLLARIPLPEVKDGS